MRVILISKAHSLHAQRWAASLAEHGMDVHLVSPTHGTVQGVPVHEIPMYDPNPFRQWKLAREARKFLHSMEPDVTHLQGLFSVSSLGAMRIIPAMDNLVVSVWGSDIVPPLDRETHKERRIKRHLLSRAAVITASSRFLAGQTARYAPPRADVRTLYWGVDLQDFQPAGEREEDGGTVKIGFCKRLHHLAAPDVMLDAFSRALEKADVALELHMAGDGPMASELRDRAEALGLGESVRWRGWISGNRSLARFFREMDVFCMPSRRESLGVAAIEAMACGIPVVSTYVGGIPEVVEHGVSGILVDSGDVEALSDALVRLAEDPDARLQMGRAGRRVAEKRFDWQHSVRNMIAIYEEILSARTRG
ncbi:MAG: glycosyltransferase family 4 protein [Desulfatibacillaceae bacterium]